MIEIKNLKKNYGDLVVFENVNAVINEGDVIAIIGPSGCGKSTLLNSINVLDRASSGQILYKGVDIMDPKCDIRSYRMKMGMVFQSFNLFGHMTVLENAIVPQMDLLGRSRQEACDKAMEYLRLVGMADRVFYYPSELSGGQKQRAAIARTLAMDPEVLLLDEPTSALDPTMVGEVEFVLKKLAKQGRTMVIVTHEMRFAREVSNRVFYLDEKGIYEEGSSYQIFENPQREKTRRFIHKLKCLELNIENEEFDVAEAFAQIESYGNRIGIEKKRVKKAQLLFEEFCIIGLLGNGIQSVLGNGSENSDDGVQSVLGNGSEKPDSGVQTAVRAVFEFNEAENKLSMNVTHSGRSGMECLDDYARFIVEGLAREIDLLENGRKVEVGQGI